MDEELRRKLSKVCLFRLGIELLRQYAVGLDLDSGGVYGASGEVWEGPKDPSLGVFLNFYLFFGIFSY